MAEGERAVREGLGEEWAWVPVRALESVDSTNLRLKEAARAGAVRAPYVLVADSQTAGRGRLGRVFVSPPGTGLYMSVLLNPPAGADPGRITILCAVAVCRAVEETAGLRLGIKWVNDLFLRGRKVCGILAERIGPGVVAGIGVNVTTPPGGFPDAAGIAGALDAKVDRFYLAGAVARHLLGGLRDPDSPDILAYYRERMFLTGKEITYTENGVQKNARVTGVADDGGLTVEGPDGKKILRTGEVSIGSGQMSVPRLE